MIENLKPFQHPATGANTEKYGPRSECGILRTGNQPIRMQDSAKPYSKDVYLYARYIKIYVYLNILTETTFLLMKLRPIVLIFETRAGVFCQI